MKRFFIKTSLVATLILASNTAFASENIDELASSLMQLRSDVETLDTSIQDEKDIYKVKMKSLAIQKSELEATVARENLKIKQIQNELAKVEKEIKEASKNSEGLKPLLYKAIALFEENIKQAIPFKTSERLADLQRVKLQLDNSQITPQKALALLWNSYDDAVRISKESGLFKQSVMIDGEARLAQIARIGSVAMYFKTPDERVGYVVKNSDRWEYKEVINKDEKKEIITLFDAFKKHIKTGYFTLPNAFVSSSEVK